MHSEEPLSDARDAARRRRLPAGPAPAHLPPPSRVANVAEAERPADPAQALPYGAGRILANRLDGRLSSTAGLRTIAVHDLLPPVRDCMKQLRSLYWPAEPGCPLWRKRGTSRPWTARS